MAESIYHVWRRGDGYVDVTSSPSQPRSHGDKPMDQFEPILSTSDWGTARQAVEDNRDEHHAACVAGWFGGEGTGGKSDDVT